MDFSIIKTEILNSRRTFRTPFKVTSMCFSPQNDLIALGSKSGDVMMKRTSWKMIWKTNVSMVPSVGTECKSESSVTALHFSPDGRFVAAATSKGLMHLLDIESGKVRFSVKIADNKISNLRWESVRDGTQNSRFGNFNSDIKNFDVLSTALELAKSTPNITREEIGFVYQALDEDGSTFKHDDNQKENLHQMIIPSPIFDESLRNTILLASNEDDKIFVLIAGVFPYLEIDVPGLLEKYSQTIIMFYDMHYSSAFGGISFLATTYGPYMDCKQDELKPPGKDPKKPGDGCHTLVFNVNLEIEPALWDAAFRYVRLLFAFNLFSVSLDTAKRNWNAQVETLHARFDTKTKNVKIGEVLLEMLLSGSTDPAGEAFLERGLGTDGLDGIRNFTNRYVPEVCRLVRGQLASSARNLCFQHCEFSTALHRYEKYVEMKDDDSFLYDSSPPNLSSATNEWLNNLEDQVNIVDVKTRQLGIQCLTMMQELGHLGKWISVTKPFAKTMKVNSLMKIKQMKIEEILRYIVRNFIADPEAAKEIEERLFNIEETCKEKKDEEEDDKFDEMEYLKELEKAAETERTQLVETFHPKYKLTAIPEKQDETPADDESNENNPNVEMETAANEETDFKVDLDRVGSFFEQELSAKALEVLPECDNEFDEDEDLQLRANRMNSDEVRKIGLIKALEDLATTLSTPHKIHRDKSGNMRSPEVLFVYEIASGAAHRGFVEAKITNVTSSSEKSSDKDQSEDLISIRKSMQVTVIEKNQLNTIVIVPTDAVTREEDQERMKNHVEKMTRNFTFQTVEARVDEKFGVQRAMEAVESMEVDENALRIEVNTEQLVPQYDTLREYNRIYPLSHGELVIVGKFSSQHENSGSLARMMRSAEKKDVFAVQTSVDGKTEVTIETMIVHPNTLLTAYLHEDGSKITIGDLKPEVESVEEEMSRPNRKTFRDYQRRRERYREDMGVTNMNDIQYDVLVQEAMDSGRDLTDPEDDDQDDDEEY